MIKFLGSLVIILLISSFEFIDAQNMSTPRVAIIGGGLAGLAAATTLQNAGISYVILEATGRLGGRVSPSPYADGFLELGAQSIDGNKSLMYKIATSLGIVMTPENDFFDEDTETSYQLGQFYKKSDLDKWFKFLESIEDIYENGKYKRDDTVGNVFRQKYTKFIAANGNAQSKQLFDKLASLYLASFDLEWSSPADELAIENYNEWDDKSDGNSYFLDKRGYKTILDNIISKIDNRNVQLNSPVSNIDYTGNRVIVRTSNGGLSAHDYVIVTIPLGYLKANQNTLFSPKLPSDKQRVINNLGFGNLMKIFFEYNTPWWSSDIEYMAIVPPSETSISSYIRLIQSLPWNNNVLIIWVIGNGPSMISTWSDDQLIINITNHLMQCTRRNDIPRPISVQKKNWRIDPFTLGSYTYLTPQSVDQDDNPLAVMRRPINKNGKPFILFAGEHTHPTMYQTTTGAYESGQREANRIVNA